jgi:Mn-dependent DtxR family transcriptional regulator
MSIATKRIISTLLSAKEGILRPTYMAVMYTYDLHSRGGVVNSHDINSTLSAELHLTRVSISRLHKMGYLEWVDTNLYKTTDKWTELKNDMGKQARSIRIS